MAYTKKRSLTEWYVNHNIIRKANDLGLKFVTTQKTKNESEAFTKTLGTIVSIDSIAMKTISKELLQKIGIDEIVKTYVVSNINIKSINQMVWLPLYRNINKVDDYTLFDKSNDKRYMVVGFIYATKKQILHKYKKRNFRLSLGERAEYEFFKKIDIAQSFLFDKLYDIELYEYNSKKEKWISTKYKEVDVKKDCLSLAAKNLLTMYKKKNKI